MTWTALPGGGGFGDRGPMVAPTWRSFCTVSRIRLRAPRGASLGVFTPPGGFPRSSRADTPPLLSVHAVRRPRRHLAAVRLRAVAGIVRELTRVASWYAAEDIDIDRSLSPLVVES